MTPSPERPPVIGLIGGMGSGKSAVAAAFARRGAVVVSGDAAGHEALRQPAIKEQVRRRWGRAVFDAEGEIDRRKLGVVVFADGAERKALEAMVHPWIERRLREQIDAAKRAGAPLIILDAAILLEAGWDKECDKLVYVEAPRDLRLQRLDEDRGWTETDVHDREEAQWPLNEKRSRANVILENTGSLKELDRQVEGLVSRWAIAN